MNSLYQDILLYCTPEEIEEKNYHVIAAKVSANRKTPNNREIGYGAILETIGIEAGNAFLDAIVATPTLRYVKPLLDRSALNASSPLVPGLLAGFVAATIITQEQADALIALGYTPVTVDWFSCQLALEQGA